MRIAEVAEQYGLSADTLRYYERIGLLRPVRRNASGVRDYSEEDCARISFVKCMRGANVSIEALIEYMQLFEQGESTLEARRQILIEQRDEDRKRLDRIQEGLDRLDYKIAHYDELLAHSAHSPLQPRSLSEAGTATGPRAIVDGDHRLGTRYSREMLDGAGHTHNCGA